MFRNPLFRLLALGVVAAPGSVGSQTAERHLAAQPVSRLAESFSEIAGVRELRDGRLILLDAKEQRLVVADLAAGTARPIGHSGQGPGEYGRAIRLVSLPADTTWVVDGAGRRVLVIGPDASPHDIITGFGKPAEDSGLTPMSLRGADGRGRLYFSGRGTPGRDPTQPPESVAVVRLERRNGAIVRVATAATPPSRVRIQMEGKEIKSVNVIRPPYSVGDEWDVAADGRVVLARRAPYRLEVAAPGGSLARSEVVPATHWPITAADKHEYVAAQPNGASIDPNSLEWPDAKPVFLPRAIVLAPGGESWVRRVPRSGAATTTYDIFDTSARRIATLTVPAALTIGLATPRGVVAIETDADGLQTVSRYPLPR